MSNNWVSQNGFLSWNEAQGNASLIFNELRSWGYSTVACCAWLGNMWVESNLNPGIWQNLFPHDANGIGLNQWTPATNLFTRQAFLGLTPNRSLNGDWQLLVMRTEMSLQISSLPQNRPAGHNWTQWINQPAEGIFHSVLWETTNIDEATRQILRGYYRAGAPALARRQQYARRFLEIFANAQSQPPPNRPALGGNQIGLQLAVVPLRHAPGAFINIVQGEMSGHSHAGSVALDFQSGWGTSGWNMPLHAPVDMVCVDQSIPWAINVWNTLRPVRWQDGTVDNFCMAIVHDNNMPSVGTRVLKGAIIGRAGTAGWVQSWGHAHIQFARGHWRGWPLSSMNQGAVSMAQVCSITDNLTGQTMDLRALPNLRPNNGRFPVFSGTRTWDDGSLITPPSGNIPVQDLPNEEPTYPILIEGQTWLFVLLQLVGVII